jgi:energy-coupling factor transporter transmembrane protein EcfT
MKSLCSPALLYLVIAVLSIIMMIYNRMPPMPIVVKALFVVIWTWFLNFLCKLGHEGISWFLVVTPFILFLFVFSMAYETQLINSLKEKEEFALGRGRRYANASYNGDLDVYDDSVEFTGRNGNTVKVTENFKGKKKR